MEGIEGTKCEPEFPKLVLSVCNIFGNQFIFTLPKKAKHIIYWNIEYLNIKESNLHSIGKEANWFPSSIRNFKNKRFPKSIGRRTMRFSAKIWNLETSSYLARYTITIQMSILHKDVKFSLPNVVCWLTSQFLLEY